MKRLKESYDEELATHVGPESCVPAREGRRAPMGRAGIEALTGESVGRVLSYEMYDRGGRRLADDGRQHGGAQEGGQTPGRWHQSSSVVLDPVHAWTHLTGNWEISCSGASTEWRSRPAMFIREGERHR